MGSRAIAALAVTALAACAGELRGGADAARDDAGSRPPGDDIAGREQAVDRSPVADAGAPFSCTLSAATPTIAPTHWLHPASPHAGQTLTIALQSATTKPAGAPKLAVQHLSSLGTRTITAYELAGGAKAIYYISVSALGAGENCIVARNGSNVELALKVVAKPPGKGTPRGNGVWKIVGNHQWRCDEQPTYGNLLHVQVRDEQGAPVSGAKVLLRPTDDTVFPVKPDATAMSWDASQHPKEMVTGADGNAQLVTPWGEGIHSPIDAKPGYLVYLVSVDGGASDVATEITTGLWEANAGGCNYCGTYGINVYGHWSYTITFKRDSKATEICEVPTDHQGQESCAYNHYFHEAGRSSCLPVAP